MRASKSFTLALALGLSVPAALAQSSGQPDAMPTPEQIAAMAAQARGGAGASANNKDEFPPFDKVIEGYEKVSNVSNGRTMWDIYVDKKSGKVLASLPRNYENQNLFIGLTFAGGFPTAGIQYGDMYAKWKRYDKRLALVEPNLSVRATSDAQVRASRDQLFTDRVIIDIPILTMGPNGGPVIDVSNLFVNSADTFFGNQVRGARNQLGRNISAKAFEENVELRFEVPARDGRLLQTHYSVSVLPENTGYRPRKADSRVGYFTTTFLDLADPSAEQPYTRYINRWKLEKADPKLAMSPPREPIVFYLEHTTPVRYRRWVREGVAAWNKSFEQVGIINAIEVYQQDALTGAHMEKDPENVKYNFIRWNANGASFAIGPSRVDPRTGQILDADVVMNDGWIRAYARQFERIIPEIAMEGFAPETLAWLDQNPDFDPRIAFAAKGDRERLISQRNAERASGNQAPMSGHAAANASHHMLGSTQYDGLSHRVSQMSGYCNHGAFKSMDIGMVRLGMDAIDAFILADSKGQNIDGVPEDFIGPLIRDVVIHEVGHVLGLRHNFVASSLYSIEEMNSPEMKGRPITASVMDYNPININYGDGPVQGDWGMNEPGPYDTWAIRYGYADDKDVPAILAEYTKRENRYLTDEDTFGPDPLARRYDFGANPLDWADSRMRLVQDLRKKILDRAIKDGDEWEKVRFHYLTLLGQHTLAVGTAANWVGGSHITRSVRDEKNDVPPIVDIDPEMQRRALRFVVDNAFNDDAFGLTNELLYRMSVSKWWDEGGLSSLFQDPTFDVHDRIAAIHTAAMTMILNPTSLRRAYDNEFRVPNEKDALTVAEIMDTIKDSVWTELDKTPSKSYTNRDPMVSSLRRNLQRQHIDRLVALARPSASFGASGKPVANLAVLQMRELEAKLTKAVENKNRLDRYTLAHLADSHQRIKQALDAQYIYNIDDIRVNISSPFSPFGQNQGN
ncbi:MAG: zinc-dependent metalloprotease [Phycisphaeraceae bacterium]|nr:zinc-dependent metalloprotease [Phycisphaeraceae bacterium]